MPSLGPRAPQPSAPVQSAWKLLDLIYEASLTPDRWASVFGTLGSLIEARPTTAVLRGFGETRYVNCDTPDEGFQQINPIQRFTTKALSHRGFVIAVVDDEIVEDWAQLPNESADESTSLVLFNAQGAALSDSARGTLKRVLPHVLRALQIHFTLDHFERERDDVESCLDKLPRPILLLDAEMNVSFANRAAERFCEEHPGVELESHRLCLRDAEDQAATLELLRGADDVEGPCAGRRLGNGLTAFATRVDAHLLALSLSDENKALPIPAGVLEQAFEWTPSESSVGALFAAGRSPVEIAATLSLSPHAVRKTVKELQAKTGATRQTDLVRRVLDSLPPFATR